MPYRGTAFGSEEQQVSLFHVAQAGDLLPGIRLGISVGVQPSAVHVRFPEAEIDEAGTVELVRTLRSQNIRLAELILRGKDHGADPSLGGLLRRFRRCRFLLLFDLLLFFRGNPCLVRVDGGDRLLSRLAVVFQGIAFLERHHGADRVRSVISGDLVAVEIPKLIQHILELFDVLPFCAFLHDVLLRVGRHEKIVRLIPDDPVGSQLMLTLEEFYGVAGRVAEMAGRLVQFQITEFHEPLLDLQDLFPVAPLLDPDLGFLFRNLRFGGNFFRFFRVLLIRNGIFLS